MSEIKKQKIVCPYCKKEFEIKIWEKLEMPYDELQKERVMKNTFFRTRCRGCEMLLPVIYDMEYNDLERKYLIWIVPKLLDGEKVRIMKFNKRIETDNTLKLAQGGYRYRLVRTDNELREKVLIFDEGLDDRFISVRLFELRIPLDELSHLWCDLLILVNHDLCLEGELPLAL